MYVLEGWCAWLRGKKMEITAAYGLIMTLGKGFILLIL